MRHLRTDPVCLRHRPPRRQLSTWWFNRHRGRSCPPCRASRVRQIERETMAKLHSEEWRP